MNNVNKATSEGKKATSLKTHNSQESVTSMEMAFKLTIHFPGKSDFIGNGMAILHPSSVKLSLFGGIKMIRVESCKTLV